MKKFVCKQVIYYFCSRNGKRFIYRLLQSDINPLIKNNMNNI